MYVKKGRGEYILKYRLSWQSLQSFLKMNLSELVLNKA